MRHLTERAHRLLCRAGFVGLCAAPTLMVSAWIVSANLPSQRTAWEGNLSARLGTRVTVASVSYPQPGVIRLEGVCVARPHEQQPLATLERLDLRRHDGAWLAETSQLMLSPENRDVWPLLYRCATQTPGCPNADIRFLAGRAVLSSPQGETLLQQVVVERTSSTSMTIACILDSGKGPAALRLDLKPQSDGSLQVELGTSDATIPAQLAGLLGPPADQLIPGVSLRGTLTCTSTIDWVRR